MSSRPRLAVVAVLAAAGVVAGGYYLWPKGRHIASCPPLHAPVPAAAKKALAAYLGRIQHDVERSRDGTHDESWYDSLTGASRQVSYDAAGRVTDEFATIPAGTFERTVTVFYDGRRWVSGRQALPSGYHGESAANGAQVNRDNVFRGRARIVGGDVVEGRPALHLREVVHIPAIKPASFHLPKGFPVPKQALRATKFTIDTWVDPVTYVTVRIRQGSSVNDESWLPRTAGNIARTRAVIPAGFRHEVTVDGSGVGFGILTGASSTRCGQ
jgi:hypothetical protein